MVLENRRQSVGQRGGAMRKPLFRT